MSLVFSGRSPRPPLSAWKVWLFRCGAIFVAAVSVELSSWLIWMTFPPLSLGNLKDLQKSVAASGTMHAGQLEVLHPYLGWVFNPDTAQENLPAGLPKINELGFVDNESSIQKRSPDRFIVGVFGGSVAQQMSMIGEQVLTNVLSASPHLQGRRIQIVKLAMSGYKQPQQLMALNYILSLGGEFDAVVNVDGYNESALAVTENYGNHIFPAYPRAWSARLADVVDPRNNSVSLRLFQIRGKRQFRGQWILGSWLQHSWTISLLWAVQDKILEEEQLNLAREIIDRVDQRGRGFAKEGPYHDYANSDAMYQDVVGIWRNSSLQMHHLCAARGIIYLHFLQPNQYHEGSKPFSPQELEKCVSHENFTKAVRDCYPRMIEEGARLGETGVAFHDLTQLFADDHDTIYSDYFCHYNERGTNKLSERVAFSILNTLASR